MGGANEISDDELATSVLEGSSINLEFSEYHYFDDVLSDLKLTPVSKTTVHSVISFLII